VKFEQICNAPARVGSIEYYEQQLASYEAELVASKPTMSRAYARKRIDAVSTAIISLKRGDTEDDVWAADIDAQFKAM
jgi:hypothetical protein